MSASLKNIVVFGGTGAQGIPVVQALTKDGKYNVRVQTRDPGHRRAKELEQLPNVTLIGGHVESDDHLREAMKGMDGVFFLANGFSMGEKSEIYWSMRAFEIARQSGIKFFQFSSLDYALKEGNYDDKFRCGHYDGKGKVAEWIRIQPTHPMKWCVLTSGPYMEMLTFMLGPNYDEASDTFAWNIPIGEGAIPLIHLADLGEYARWVFENPDQSNGTELKIATQHVSGQQIVEAFTKVTGKKAVYKSDELQHWLDNYAKKDALSAHSIDPNDPSAMTWHKNFTGWYNMWIHSGGPKPVISRDYNQLDKILPDRVKTVEEWMRKTNYDGRKTSLLKDKEDNRGVDRFVDKFRSTTTLM